MCDLTGIAELVWRVRVKTGDSTGMIAPIVSADGGTTWSYMDGSSCVAGAAAPAAPAAVYAVALTPARYVRQTVPVPVAYRANDVLLAIAAFSGAGGNPVLSALSFGVSLVG